MLKKTITYPDLDGNEVTEDFYFNLTEAELTKMQLSTAGGMENRLQRVIDSGDGKQIIDTFDELLALAYGKRSADGKSFVKKPEYYDEFKGSEAYSKLFMELVTDAQKSAEFFTAVVPSNLSEKMQQEYNRIQDVPAVQDVQLPEMDPRKMSHEELIAAYRAKLQS